MCPASFLSSRDYYISPVFGSVSFLSVELYGGGYSLTIGTSKPTNIADAQEFIIIQRNQKNSLIKHLEVLKLSILPSLLC